MRIRTISLLLSITLIVIACNTKQKKTKEKTLTEKYEMSDADALVEAIEKAHNKEKFLSEKSVQFDLNLIFGGKNRFNGTITMTPDGKLVKMVGVIQDITSKKKQELEKNILKRDGT